MLDLQELWERKKTRNRENLEFKNAFYFGVTHKFPSASWISVYPQGSEQVRGHQSGSLVESEIINMVVDSIILVISLEKDPS